MNSVSVELHVKQLKTKTGFFSDFSNIISSIQNIVPIQIMNEITIIIVNNNYEFFDNNFSVKMRDTERVI